MFKLLSILYIVSAVLSAELPRHNLQETAFNPDPNAEPVSTHPVSKKASEPELDPRPIYRAEDKETGRARVQPVKPTGPVVKYDQMLADQPNGAASEVNRVDIQQIPNYAFVPTQPEVAYPDIPYAPGYGYDGYPQSNGYDVYGNSVGNYYEPDTSSFSLLWSQVPDSRTIVNYAGRAISWLFSSIFVLLIGSLMTIGVCTYTNLCTIAFHGVGPIHEEMRSLITPERLENISTAATLVKSAIDKYQKIQNVDAVRRRRANVHN
ncbi:uncharacterized protein LOC134752597 [Cydia strobilella]|uniref:uncharacterized protein LOC134752597 n=1 Tax=Cydia strobilella TaxID=1100964 RepID=UPI003003FECF